MANYIYAINDSTSQSVEGFDNIGNVIYHFYQNLLGSQDSLPKKLDPEIIAHGPTLSMTQKIRLCMDFADQDIKEVMFSIPNTKSPGPDGYSSGFFKSTLSTIGPMVCSAIQSFFSNWRDAKEHK